MQKLFRQSTVLSTVVKLESESVSYRSTFIFFIEIDVNIERDSVAPILSLR